MARKAAPVTYEKTKKLTKSIPSSENGAPVTYKTKSGKMFYITHCRDKHRFTLWRIVSDGYEKMCSSDSPYNLYPIADKE